jgi:hypothetical protein
MHVLVEHHDVNGSNVPNLQVPFAAGPTVSVLNTAPPPVPPGQVAFAAGPTVSVLNAAAPDAIAGHTIGPVVSVENLATP